MSAPQPAPLVTFTCQPNSHSFEERQIALTDHLKIGRSVARARPATNNAIFDCKVLSRNHAIVWYEADKFWIKDTKSSNGTFVNSHRLSKGSEESSPRQLFTGDIIQFGVDVVENTTTHGCIIAQMSLFHSDGSEAKRKEEDYKMTENSTNGSYSNLSQEQIYQLAQYLQEALYREQTLEKKLESLQKSLTLSEEASANGWQVLLNEEHLLSKLDLLENQLQIYVKNYSEDNLRGEAARAYEERYQIERQCQTAIERLLEEKAITQRKEALLESRLASFELENAIIKRKYEEQLEQINEQKAEIENSDKNQENHDPEACLARYAELDEVKMQLEQRLQALQKCSEDKSSVFTEEKETQSQDSSLSSDYESLKSFTGTAESDVTTPADSTQIQQQLLEDFSKFEAALDSICVNGLDNSGIEKVLLSFDKISAYPPANDAMLKLESILKKLLKIKSEFQQSPCTDLDIPSDEEKSIPVNTQDSRNSLIQEIESLKAQLSGQINIALELEKKFVGQKEHSTVLEQELVHLQKDLLTRQSLSYSDSSTLTENMTATLMTTNSTQINTENEEFSSCDKPEADHLADLRRECDRLREVVAWIEQELRSTRVEHDQMKVAYVDCQQERDRLRHASSSASRSNTGDEKPSQDVAELEHRCEQQAEELRKLRDLHSLELRALSARARFFSVCTVLPLMIVLAAIMIAFFWKLA